MEFRPVGIGLIAAGITILLYGISVYQHGSDNPVIQTKVGHGVYGTEAGNPFYILTALAGGISFTQYPLPAWVV
ncbi:MAG: hypothetical protein DRP64_06550 [Verrucomicrobia bacterium]|nr:MAG: hypothetical protein DRP64_06550 [Verrucomicrobiota bacterium]